MSLYHKYRPEALDDIQGNEKLKESLRTMLSDDKRCPHVFLLHGPTGCGKTTIGRIIARELDVDINGSDYTEIDTADFRGIDTARSIREKVNYKPIQGDRRIWLIDECHKLTNDAQNALLKGLEEPPGHVYFILCTTNPENLIPTLKRRCTQFQVEILEDKEMLRLLRHVVKGEEESMDRQVYNQIVEDSNGYPAHALQILEKVLSTEQENRLEVAEVTANIKNESIDLCRALIEGAGWKRVSSILTGLKGQDPESIRRHVIGYCQGVLLSDNNKGNDRAALIIEELWEPLYNIGFPGLVFACYSINKN